MNLNADQLTVLTMLRDGKHPHQIAKLTGWTWYEVNNHIKAILGEWKKWASSWIKYQAHVNQLRYELLWSLISNKLQATADDPDPKLLTVGVNLLDKYNRMIDVGTGVSDSSWLKRPAGSVTNLDAECAAAGLDVPKLFVSTAPGI